VLREVAQLEHTCVVTPACGAWARPLGAGNTEGLEQRDGAMRTTGDCSLPERSSSVVPTGVKPRLVIPTGAKPSSVIPTGAKPSSVIPTGAKRSGGVSLVPRNTAPVPKPSHAPFAPVPASVFWAPNYSPVTISADETASVSPSKIPVNPW
jgi:hypothetical protein